MRQRVLAVIAHPDDETIFMGGTILSNPFSVWRVLCATYEENSTRAQEALKAMRYYQASGIDIEIVFLGHEDKHKTPDGGIDRLKLSSQLLDYRSWPDIVITHNEKGDYGNNAHISVNQEVMRIYPESWEILCEDQNRFPVVKREIVWEIKLSPTVQERKRQIFVECYPSQQLLWTRTTYLVEWAFNLCSERFGRIKS